MDMRTTNKFVFFWGNDDIYSNFYYFPFKHQGIEFKWSEQAIMYRKANLFGAKTIADRILKAQTPKQCKDLGRSNDIPFNEKIWIANRDIILVEASPFDKIWGIGIGENDKRAENPKQWKGLNLLGKVLMEVRSKLK